MIPDHKSFEIVTKVWHELTEAQRAMEYRWRDVVRYTATEMSDADESLTDAKKEANRREIAVALANYPFSESWQRTNRERRGHGVNA